MYRFRTTWKTIKKNIYSEKIFKLIKFSNFFIFQGLLHEIRNLIAPEFLQNLQSGPIVIYYTLYNNSFYTQLAPFLLVRKILITFMMILKLFCFFFFSNSLISFSGLSPPSAFLFFEKIFIFFTFYIFFYIFPFLYEKIYILILLYALKYELFKLY